ncbi:MAG: hypothetical protein HFF52_03395 [Lawsonibacter sp.]|nr:hypothetical protein [Lawsonibacter sp.]
MAKRKLPRLGRGQRILCNLVLTLICLYALWARAGYPLPTAELEFRRMERTHLLPRSEIVFNSGKDGPLLWRDLPEPGFLDRDAVVGMTKNQVYVYVSGHNRLEICSLEDGIFSIPMYGVSAVWTYRGNLKMGTPLLFLNVPEETERAEVEVWLDGQQRAGNGWGLKNGVWLLCLGMDTAAWSPERPEDGVYTLRLYRADGSLLLEKSGRLGE